MKFLICSLLAVGIATLIGVNMVSAHGWFGNNANLDLETIVEKQNRMFEEKASFLGISVDKIKEYWVQGRNIKEIAEEIGIGEEVLQEKMKQARQGKTKERLQILVDNEVITQAQADQRLQFMEERFENGKMRGMGKGFGKGFGCRDF